MCVLLILDCATSLINLYELKCTNEIETWILIEYRRSCMCMYVGKNAVGSALYYRREAWFSVINDELYHLLLWTYPVSI